MTKLAEELTFRARELAPDVKPGFAAVVDGPDGWPVCHCGSGETARTIADALNALRSTGTGDVEGLVESELIDHMARRFLTWKLPKNFNPDAGISFKPIYPYREGQPPHEWPVGTNLFSYEQATEMVRHMLADTPALSQRIAELEAMLAGERERCAQVAEHLNGWGNPRAPELAEHIAKCIRNLPESTDGGERG